jgi:hypothetical protein
MKITRQKTGEKLIDYLQHRISLKELVNWAENAIMDEDFEEKEMDLLREVIGQIGLADVRQFGMTWEKCEDVLHRLGYSVRLTVLKSA